MRYQYTKPIPPGAMLISLHGVYGIKVNQVTQVIIDSKKGNLVINLNESVLNAIQDHPDFVCLDQPKEEMKRPVVPKEQLEDRTLPAEKLDKLFKNKEVTEAKTEEPSPESKAATEEAAPAKKTTKKRGRPTAKKKTDTES